jgi:hypothetical protein
VSQCTLEVIIVVFDVNLSRTCGLYEQVDQNRLEFVDRLEKFLSNVSFLGK